MKRKGELSRRLVTDVCILLVSGLVIFGPSIVETAKKKVVSYSQEEGAE